MGIAAENVSALIEVMNDETEKALQDRIEAFARDVTSILKQAVADAVSDALGAGRGSARVARAVKRDRAGRRTGAQVKNEADVLLREVRRKSGQRMEQIAKNMRVSTKALVLPMNALLKAKKVKKSGVARGTTYRAA